MANSKAHLKQAPAPDDTHSPSRIYGSKAGWVAGSDGGGGVLVDFEGNPGKPVPARLAVALEAKVLQEAAAARRQVVLTFEEGDPQRPFLMAFLHTPSPSPTPLLDTLLDLPAEAAGAPVEARVDGKRVVIEGANEVVLACGKASITLWRNGRIVLRGVQVESYATGKNRIKGGSVEIN